MTETTHDSREQLMKRIMLLARRDKANMGVLWGRFASEDDNLYVTVTDKAAARAVKGIAPDAIVTIID